MRSKFLQKFFALFLSLVINFNSVGPLFQLAYADDLVVPTPTPTVSQEITPTPTENPIEIVSPTPTGVLSPTPEISPTPIIELIPTLAPEITATPTPTIIELSPTPTATPTPTIIVEPTVEPTLIPEPTTQPVLLTPTPTPAEILYTPAPTAALEWTQNEDGSYTASGVVETNKVYLAPQNNQVKIKFTSLPSVAGSLTIKEIKLSAEQVKQSGSLSDTAYDITSSMENGTFSYDLTLPIPPASYKNIEVKSVENPDAINDAQIVVQPKEVIEDAIVIRNLNHFTAFIVFTQQPTLFGVDFLQKPVVAIKDDVTGNVITTATDRISISAFSDSSCEISMPGALSGTTEISAVEGIARFTDLQYTLSGTFYLKATDSDRDIPSVCSSVTVLSSPTPTAISVGGTVNIKNTLLNLVSTILTSNDINWLSDNSSVATIDSAGVITAVGVGEATITATVVNSVTVGTAYIPVTVSLSPPASPDHISIIPGRQYSIKTNFVNQFFTQLFGIYLSPEISWSSSDSAVATVNSSGVVTGVSAGTARISGSANYPLIRGQGYIPVEVTSEVTPTPTPTPMPTPTPAVISLVFSDQPAAVALENTSFFQQPEITVRNADGSTLTSATEDISIVAFTDSGCTDPTSTSISGGSTTRSAESGVATFSGLKYNSTGTIYLGAADATRNLTSCSNAIVVSSPSSATISVNGELSIGSHLVDLFNIVNDSTSLNWVSGNPLIATVDGNGVITGVSNGSTEISVGVTTPIGVGIIHIPVEISATPSSNPSHLVIAPGSTYSLKSVDFVSYLREQFTLANILSTQYSFTSNPSGIADVDVNLNLSSPADSTIILRGLSVGETLVTGSVTSNTLSAEGYVPVTVEKASTSIAVTPVASSYGSTVSLSATLTSNGTPVAGGQIDFSLNGQFLDSSNTNSSGVATMSNVSLAGISVGSHDGMIGASFATDSTYLASSASGDLTITDPIADAFDTVSAALAGNGIANNLDQVNLSNVSNFSGLYFEKSVSGTPVGKLTFTNALDLSSSGTQTFLQNLGTKLEAGNGRIAFDARTSAVFAATGATLEMYNIVSPVSSSNIIVRDDAGVVQNPSGIVSGFSYDSVAHKVTFTAAHFTQFDLDTTAPATSDNTDSSWHSSSQTITLTCSDNLSGCDKTYYTTNGDNPTTASAQGNSVVLSNDGIYTIKYFSVDIAENTENVKTAVNTVKIDKTKPTNVTASDSGTYANNPHLTFTWPASSEDGSGINYYRFYLNTATSNTTPTPLINGTNIGNVTAYTLSDSEAALLSNGTTYYAKVRAVDNIGNVQSSGGNWSNGITLDTASPVLAEVAAITTPTNDTTPNYTFNSTEAGAISYAGDCLGSDTTAALGNNTVTFSALSSGTHNNCTIQVADVAGNVSNTLNVPSFIVDTTDPIITLLGSTPVVIEVGSTYTDAGATASDNLDGNITLLIEVTNPVNSNIVGVYTVTYGVSDAAGNDADEVVRTVNVVDTTKPTISLTGANPQTIEVKSAYSELGATATDNYSGNITSAIVINSSAVNVNVVGSYTVAYNVTDVNGNAANQIVRIVNVVDTTKPVITLTGSGTQTIEVKAAYSELGATATDNYDSSVTVTINSTAVNTNAVGSYQVTYNAVDAAGNRANQFTRTVNIVDTEKPIIILTGSTPTIIEVHGTYAEQGATVTDNYDSGLTAVITGTVDVDTVGTYTVHYNVQDSSRNVATEVTRTVNIVDTTKPIITLLGVNPTTVEAGLAYIDAGATALDNYDGTITSSIVTVNHVNSNVVGTYSVIYNVTDAYGNAATEVVRTVTVVDATAPAVPVIVTTAQAVNTDTIHIIGTAEANSTVTIAGGVNIATGTTTGGNFNLAVTLNHNAINNLSVTATDAANNVSLAATVAITHDNIAPTVTKLGNDSADVVLSVGDTNVVFSEVLSNSSKTTVINGLTAKADKALTYAWSGATLTIHATETTTFANDVMVNVSDVAGNTATNALIVDSQLNIAPTQTTPNVSGSATVNPTTPQVVITNPIQPVNVIINAGTTNPTIDVSSFITSGTGTVPQITISSDDADIAIPATTTVTSTDSAWNGVIAAPTVTTVTLPETTGETKTLSTAIEVGFAGAKLSFDNAVRILLPGQAGKRAGYVRTGITFTEITNICAADTQASGNALAADSECKIDVGADLAIWTKHFTKFASYTQTTNSSSSGSSSSSSSGGSTGDGKSDGLGCGSRDCSGNVAAQQVLGVYAKLAVSESAFATGAEQEVLGTISAEDQGAAGAEIEEVKGSSDKANWGKAVALTLVSLFVLGSIGFWISKSRKRN